MTKIKDNYKTQYSYRDFAYSILNRIETENAYVNILLDSVLKKNNIVKPESSILTELVYGILRQKRCLDWILNQFLKENNNPLPLRLQNIFRIGIYQILFMNSIPDYAAVNETVKLAVRNRFASRKNFINAVLRNIIRNKSNITYPDAHSDLIQYLGVKYSHPDWIIKIFLEQYGDEDTARLCEINNQPAPITIKINTLKISIDDYIRLLIRNNISYQLSPYVNDGLLLESSLAIRNLPGYTDGLFHIQDISSQLICRLVEPKPNEIILDLCAAPGGKTFTLAQQLNQTGQIIALDIHPGRLKLLHNTAMKLGLNNIQTYCHDATKNLSDIITKPVDKILIDAPCSGLGVLRRKPDARWNKSPENIPKLLELQNKLLYNSIHYLKNNGIVVYSTCTLNKEENENQIQLFLSHNPEFHRIPANKYLSKSAQKMVTKSGYLSTLPHRDNTDGIFGSCLQKGGKL